MKISIDLKTSIIIITLIIFGCKWTTADIAIADYKPTVIIQDNYSNAVLCTTHKLDRLSLHRFIEISFISADSPEEVLNTYLWKLELIGSNKNNELEFYIKNKKTQEYLMVTDISYKYIFEDDRRALLTYRKSNHSRYKHDKNKRVWIFTKDEKESSANKNVYTIRNKFYSDEYLTSGYMAGFLISDKSQVFTQRIKPPNGRTWKITEIF